MTIFKNKPFIVALLISALATTAFFLPFQHKVKSELKIAISPWPGYEPLALALHKGFYNDVDIRIIRFATPTESYRALRDGLVDVAAFTADEALHYAELDKQPKIFHILDVSNGGDSILAHPSIKTLDDLKGQRVGVEDSALSSYIIHRAMDFTKNNLKVSDFTLIPIEIGRHAEAYSNHQVDALVTYEPSKTNVLNMGAREIFNSSQIPYEVVDILLTEEQIIHQKSDALQALIDGWYKAIAWTKTNPEKAYAWMAKQENLTPAEFKEAFEELIIPSKTEVNNMLSTGEKSLIPVLNRLVDQMHEKGSIQNKIAVEPILSPLKEK